MGTFTLASDLAAPPAAVWSHVTTMSGIDDELRPWLRMRPPAAWRGASITDLPLGEPLGRAWLLLGGVLPVEYDALTIVEHEPGRLFAERSTMLSLRTWTHRRTVEAAPGGCRVTDTLGFEPRLRALEPVARAVVRALFIHRHRRLVARFGPPPR